MDEEKKAGFGETMRVAGSELVDSIRRLVEQGNVRSIILWSEDDRKLLELNLNAGLAIGGVAVLLAPFMAALVGIAALFKKVRLEIVRKDQED